MRIMRAQPVEFTSSGLFYHLHGVEKMTVIQFLTYAAVLVFLIVVLAKVIKYKSTPIHLRWELYPVAHERGRASYGGSIFEEMEWWEKPRDKDRFNELKEMFEEIVLLKGVYHNNRKMWYSSFPFHLGLYLVTGWLALLIVGAILALLGMEVSNTGGFVGKSIHYLTGALGYGGFVLAAIGSFGLFMTRLKSPELKYYNTPMEFFNLVFVGVVMVVAFIASLTVDPGFAIQREFTATLLSFKSTAGMSMPAAVQVEIVLAMLLLAYMPITRMSHFVAKYFLYHEVRWEDEPNVRGSKIESRVMNALNFGVGWGGPHIQKGKKWSEVITENKE